MTLILDKLSDALDEKQKLSKFRNLLHAMSKRDQTIVKEGNLHKGRWVLRSSSNPVEKTNSRQTGRGVNGMNRPSSSMSDLQPLLTTLGQLIAQARQQAVRAVDVVQVQTCWDIGRHIVEFEQGGAARASPGCGSLGA